MIVRIVMTTSSSWATVNVVHDFFPLVGGHAISDCFQCHQQGGNFTGLSPVCDNCHHDKYLATTDPNHVQNNYPQIAIYVIIFMVGHQPT